MAANTPFPETIGPYLIRERIGTGGMAAVYQATDMRSQREVALKVLALHLADQTSIRRRFEREAKTLLEFEHPHILPVYDFGEADGTLYLAMRLLSGQTLADCLKQGDPLPLPFVCQLTRQIASALDYAHTRHVIHRDVKPSNILLDADDTPFLADFGVAHDEALSARLTTDGRFVGTVAYASPEQCRGEKLTYSTDTYSLGIVVFQMLTGHLPFHGPTALAVIKQHMNEPPPNPIAFNANLPLDLYAVLAQALAKLPEHRYPAALHFSAALDHALGIQCDPVAVTDDDAWLHDPPPPPAAGLDEADEEPPEPALWEEPGDIFRDLEAEDIVFDEALDDDFAGVSLAEADFPPLETDAEDAPAPNAELPAIQKLPPRLAPDHQGHFTRGQLERLGVYGTIAVAILSLVAAAVIVFTEFYSPGPQLDATYRSAETDIAFGYPPDWSITTGSGTLLGGRPAAFVIVSDRPVAATGPYAVASIAIAVQRIDPIAVFGITLSCQTRIYDSPAETFACMQERQYFAPAFKPFDTRRYKGATLPGTLPPTRASLPMILLARGQSTWIAVMIVHWDGYQGARELLSDIAESAAPLE
jgi:hypothetical protein